MFLNAPFLSVMSVVFPAVVFEYNTPAHLKMQAPVVRIRRFLTADFVP
jgi:hypothetical protein